MRPYVRPLLVLLLVAFTGLGVAYGLMTPCFEGRDEAAHLSTVRYMGTTRALLPRFLPDRRTLTGADVARSLADHDSMVYYAPPLYYSLAALLVSWADMDDFSFLLVPSPSWEAGWAPQAGRDPWNKNIYAHRAEETLGQSGTVQAAYLLRLVSLGLGAGTVLCTYALARLLWSDRPVLALGAAAVVALNPLFIAISAGVTNDNLLNMLFSLFLVGALGCMRGGAPWSRWAMLGGLAGLALLTKQSALLLLPLGCLAVIWQAGDGPPTRRKVLVDGGAFLAAALGVGGWWYVRGAILYGDPLGLEPHFAGQVPLTNFGLSEAWTVFRSYWAAFGWALILVEPAVYVVIGLGMLLAFLGVVGAVRPGGSLWRLPAVTRRGLALLALASALNVASMVRWAMATGALDGRFLLPTVAAVAVLSAWGLSRWTRWSGVRWAWGLWAGVAFAFAALVPWRYLRPAYASPRLPRGVPATAESVEVAFRNGLRLAGYEVTVGSLEPGKEFGLALYWRAEQEPGRRYRVFVQLGPQDATRHIAGDDVWLGGTLYPSELWNGDDTVRQVHRLFIPDWAPAPGLYWVRIGLVDEAEERVALADGTADVAILGPWRLHATAPPVSPAFTSHYSLGAAIRLLGYDLECEHGAGGETLQVTLHWQAEQVPEADHTVYVHLLDAQGRLLGQHDGPPRDGAYPTSWWLPGQVVVDQHTIRLAQPITGTAWLRVGMYEHETQRRIPAYDGVGRRLPEDTIPLAEVTSTGTSTPCASD